MRLPSTDPEAAEHWLLYGDSGHILLLPGAALAIKSHVINMDAGNLLHDPWLQFVILMQ